MSLANTETEKIKQLLATHIDGEAHLLAIIRLIGPILPVIKYGDLDDVIARANASPYGLGVEWGSESLLEFTAMQVINETRAILNQCTK